MRIMEQSDGNRRIREAMLRVIVTLVALFVFTPFFAKGPASAEEDVSEDGYESKIYGIVEKAPPGKIGVWSVNKREVKVSSATRIIEKHGKAEAGAYVEVEGNNTGKTFSASRIEVKRAKLR